jgi:hypothetical protein
MKYFVKVTYAHLYRTDYFDLFSYKLKLTSLTSILTKLVIKYVVNIGQLTPTIQIENILILVSKIDRLSST